MSSPIAVGAVGGSGTRIIAQILSEAGIHMGATLNNAHDNLWFTFLLKRPQWMTQFPDPRQITDALSLFARASTTGLRDTLTLEDVRLIRQIQKELAASPRNMGVPPAYAEQIIASPPIPLQDGARWGWKEPNSHIFLPQIAQVFPHMKYIHVIRNGFDMTFSRNTQQARNWSAHVTGTPLPEGEVSPSQLLDYWTAANKQALSHGHALLGDRFHVINYETLCDAPEGTLGRLFDFLDLPRPAPYVAAKTKPSTQGRHEEQGLKVFSDRQQGAVNALMASAHSAPLFANSQRYA